MGDFMWLAIWKTKVLRKVASLLGKQHVIKS